MSLIFMVRLFDLVEDPVCVLYSSMTADTAFDPALFFHDAVRVMFGPEPVITRWIVTLDFIHSRHGHKGFLV